MPTFRDWLERTLSLGESVLDAPAALLPAHHADVDELLRAAFATHALDVAGPPLTFDAAAARDAAVALARACWFLVRPPEDTSPVTLTLAANPSPAAHLSADVALRLLPAVHRRARLREPGGVLARLIEALLREWPLSGVLADLNGAPTSAPEFGGHAGLQLLYAERLATTGGRAGWVPVSSPARDRAERVYHGLGKPLPAAPPEEPEPHA
ncbi:hypothetical protein [Gemmata sp.]|uniref:hypothetical protein n=1 Tax=Gemmata sp. TaxID=1914242 RepID=UPI003F6ED5AB